jgi:hypothetical protein
MISLLLLEACLVIFGNDAHGLDRKWKLFKERFQCNAEFELAQHSSDEINIYSNYEIDEKASVISAYKRKHSTQLDLTTVRMRAGGSGSRCCPSHCGGPFSLHVF